MHTELKESYKLTEKIFVPRIQTKEKLVYLKFTRFTYQLPQYPFNLAYLHTFYKKIEYMNIHHVSLETFVWYAAHKILLNSQLFFYNLYHPDDLTITKCSAILVKLFVF